MLTLWTLSLALAAEPVHLDAGGLVGPVLEGFDRLHLEGADDPRATWSVAPRGVQVQGGPDPVRADHLVGGTLHLALPEGRWTGRVLLGHAGENPFAWAGTAPVVVRADGDEVLSLERKQPWDAWLHSHWFAANPRPVFVDGASAWDRAVAPRTPWRPLTLDVGEGGVDLEVEGLALMALVLWPEGQEAESEVDAVLVDTACRSWFDAYRAPPLRHPPLVDGPLSTTWLAPTLSPDQAPWSPHLGLDDRVHRLLRIEGGDAGGTWSVEAPEGLAVEVSEATWIDQAGHPSRPLRPRPTILEPGHGWRGEQGVPPVLSLTIRTTPTSPPGVHEVQLHLTRGDERHVRPLAVHVHDVRLDPGMPVGLFWQVPQDATLRTGFASEEVTTLVDEQLDLLADHGLTALSARYALWPGRYPDAGADADAVESAVIDHVAEGWAARGGRMLLWSDPKIPWRRPAYRRATGPVLPPPLRPSATALLAVALDQPLPVWIHAYEEEAWRDLTAPGRAPQLAELLRRLAPGDITLMGTAPTATDLPIAGALDVVFVGGGAEAVAEVRAAGAAPWTYNQAPGRASPIQAWAAEADGHMQWHASPRSDDPGDHTVQPLRWFHLVRTPEGTRATVLLAELAAGIADQRLLATLEARADVGGRPGREARHLVTTARSSGATSVPTPMTEGSPWPHHAVDALRRQALDLLGARPRTR